MCFFFLEKKAKEKGATKIVFEEIAARSRLTVRNMATTIVVTTKVVRRSLMSVLSVRMSEAEYKALEGYAAANGISMNKAIKDAFFEMLEDQYDLEAFDRAYAEYLKDPKTYTSDEVAKELGIK